MPPLRLDATPLIRRSLEKSSSQSSVSSTRAYTPSSSVPSTPVIPTRPPSPETKILYLGDCNAFLTALAAQERRVLELKEELQKAEGELEKLKKQWATHEATKKRNELRHLEQLQPLKTFLGGSDLATSCDDDLKITGRDLDRRKMAPPMVKPSRTVFSGSRHTRTLSLLSPKDSLAAGSHLPSPSHVSPKRHRFSINGDAIPNTIQGSSNSTDGPSDSDGLYKGPPKDMILETGKQLVGDFRHGLWTFFEDLRQVTVGDEAVSTSDLRNQQSMLAGNMLKTQAKRERVLGVKSVPDGKAQMWPPHLATNQPTNSVDTKERHPISAGTEISADVGPLSLPAAHTQRSNANSNSSDSDDDDGWDNWDTVTTTTLSTRGKKATSAADLLSSPLTNKSSPRTSTR